MISHFRGRRLHALPVKLPESHRGVLLETTEEIVTHRDDAARENIAHHDDFDQDVAEQEPQPEVKIMRERAVFDELLIWRHDVVPEAAEDEYAKGVGEWIAWAAVVSLASL